MSVFNRLAMLLVSLVLLAFGIVTFLLLNNLMLPSNPFLRNLLGPYQAWRVSGSQHGAGANVAPLIALLLALIGLVLLILELWPLWSRFRGHETKQYVVAQDTLGKVTVGRSMVLKLVRHEAEAVPGVVHAEPGVKDGPDGLRVSARASLALDADAPGIGQLIQERIKESVRAHLGLLVSEVQVTAQPAPEVKEQRRRVA